MPVSAKRLIGVTVVSAVFALAVAYATAQQPAQDNSSIQPERSNAGPGDPGPARPGEPGYSRLAEPGYYYSRDRGYMGPDDWHPNRIRIEYVPPANADNQTIYLLAKDRQLLEKLQQIFSPLVLPADLTIRTSECGAVNAAYYKRPVVTICYDYLNEVLTNAPKETTPEGITSHDAVAGQFFFTAAHEMGHAVFDQLAVPLFGREEVAADQFAAFIMLAVGKQNAHKLIAGAAYGYRDYLKNPQVTLAVTAFSDVHESSVQRFYNLLCTAYGADPKGFADVVEKGYLPEARSKHCAYEYWNIRYAFQQLIRPYLDPWLVHQVMEASLFEDINPPQRPSSDTAQDKP